MPSHFSKRPCRKSQDVVKDVNNVRANFKRLLCLMCQALATEFCDCRASCFAARTLKHFRVEEVEEFGLADC